MLVLLSFEDDEHARTLIEDMTNHPGDCILTPVQENSVPGKVEAVYKMPTKFHAPFETHGNKKTDIGWTMGQKFGWMICNTCHMPSKLYWETIIENQSSFGKNLLKLLLPKKEEVDAEVRSPSTSQ